MPATFISEIEIHSLMVLLNTVDNLLKFSKSQLFLNIKWDHSTDDCRESRSDSSVALRVSDLYILVDLFRFVRLLDEADNSLAHQLNGRPGMGREHWTLS